MSHRGGGGNWNRGGRRSGGDRNPTIPVNIAEVRRDKAIDAATDEFQQQVTRTTMNLVVAMNPGISIEDALKESGRLLRLVAEECERAELLPTGGDNG